WLRIRCAVSVSVEIVAGCDDFCRALLFFLSPRRRSGERTEERGGPSSPQPPPPSDGGEGVFGCGFAALCCIAGFHSARRWGSPARGIDPTLCRIQFGDTAD